MAANTQGQALGRGRARGVAGRATHPPLGGGLSGRARGVPGRGRGLAWEAVGQAGRGRARCDEVSPRPPTGRCHPFTPPPSEYLSTTDEEEDDSEWEPSDEVVANRGRRRQGPVPPLRLPVNIPPREEEVVED